MNDIQMSFFLSENEKKSLERLSELEHRSMSNQIRFVIRKYIEKNYPKIYDEIAGD